MASQSDNDELKCSQDSFSLLLTGGNTGVPLEHHIPITSFAESPVFPDCTTFMSRMPRLASDQSIFSSGGQSITAPSVTEVESKPERELLTEQMPGNYNFDLKFEEKENYPKNFPHCFCREKDTLIVRDNVSIPLTFTALYSMRELAVNIVAVFSSKDNFHQPVLPCNNHSGSSQGVQRHFITCSNPHARDTVYQGRHHIHLVLEHCRDVTGNGTEITENVTFTCRSSCSVKSGNKGINHKQLSLICQLETLAGAVIGRRVVSLKVSVSPGRDIETLLRQSKRKRSRAGSETQSPGASGPQPVAEKRRATVPEGVGKYSVVVNCLEGKKILQSIANALDARKNAGLQLAEEWASYIGTEELASQQSVATQENGSQPDLYSLEGWLKRYGLDCYVNKLEEHGFGDPGRFQTLEDRDLDRMGITDLCHRNTLKHAASRILLRGLQKVIKDGS